MAKPKHILVIRLSAMGDVAMTVPVIRAFNEEYPEVRLTILTKPFFKPLFRGIKNLEVIVVEVEDKHKGVSGLYKLSRQIRALGVDAVADLHNVLRSNILKRLLFIKPFIQIDKGRAEKKALVSGKSFKQLKSTHQRYADVFETLGFPLELSQPNFPKPAELNSNIQDVLGSGSSQLIGIAPFAAFEGKVYPLEKMETVIRDLSEAGKRVVLFGASGREANQLEQISDAYNNVFNVAGKLSFEE
ncbi:MAG: glycosyltransferase family 9 protein, partial [Psychroserpens sp.]|nr:glycosyltransferase family 9 protein [Psychroserpens sp.]